MGMGPGDPFPTITAAAKDWGITYNGQSILINRELGSSIYYMQNGASSFYSYNEPKIGSDKGVNGNKEVPKGGERIAKIHSHAAYVEGFRNNEFSGIPKFGSILSSKRGDIGSANEEQILSFVTTPNGSLQKYDPKRGEISIVSTNMPSDPKDPDRLNKIDPIQTKPDYHIPNSFN